MPEIELQTRSRVIRCWRRLTLEDTPLVAENR